VEYGQQLTVKTSSSKANQHPSSKANQHPSSKANQHRVRKPINIEFESQSTSEFESQSTSKVTTHARKQATLALDNQNEMNIVARGGKRRERRKCHITDLIEELRADVDGRGFAGVASVLLERKPKNGNLLTRDCVEEALDDTRRKPPLLDREQKTMAQPICSSPTPQAYESAFACFFRVLFR
jgi:hypothetical protein